MYSSNNCFFKLFMRIWDFMTPRSSMNLRILKSNKDEKAYRKWNQTTAQVSTCPSVNFSNRKKKKKITLKVNVSRSVVSNSCNPMDCSLPGCSVHGILQAKILERITFPVSRGSSQPRDQTQVSCIAGKFFTIWATREGQNFAEF